MIQQACEESLTWLLVFSPKNYQSPRSWLHEKICSSHMKKNGQNISADSHLPSTVQSLRGHKVGSWGRLLQPASSEQWGMGGWLEKSLSSILQVSCQVGYSSNKPHWLWIRILTRSQSPGPGETTKPLSQTSKLDPWVSLMRAFTFPRQRASWWEMLTCLYFLLFLARF